MEDKFTGCENEDRSSNPPSTSTTATTTTLSQDQQSTLASLVAGQLASQQEGRGLFFPPSSSSSSTLQALGPAAATMFTSAPLIGIPVQQQFCPPMTVPPANTALTQSMWLEPSISATQPLWQRQDSGQSASLPLTSAWPAVNSAAHSVTTGTHPSTLSSWGTGTFPSAPVSFTSQAAVNFPTMPADSAPTSFPTPFSSNPSLTSTDNRAPLSVNSDDSCRWTVEDLSESDEETDDPFKAIPALRGFRLSGARVALGRTRSYREPSEQALQFWFHARGFHYPEGWKSVRASKLTASYTGHSKATPFTAQVRHPAFPLDESAVRRDEGMAQQQTRLGAAAHAVCLALTKANEVSARLSTTGASPSADPPTPDEPSLTDLLCQGLATPLGHVLRVLAAECSAQCRDRRQLCLQTMADAQGRAMLEKLPPSPTHLFDGDIDALLQTIKHRFDARGAFKVTNPARKRARQFPQAFSHHGDGQGGKRARNDRPPATRPSSGPSNHNSSSPSNFSGNSLRGQPFRQQPFGTKQGRWAQSGKSHRMWLQEPPSRRQGRQPVSTPRCLAKDHGQQLHPPDHQIRLPAGVSGQTSNYATNQSRRHGTTLARDRAHLMDDEVRDLHQKGAIEPCHRTPGFYSKVFLVPKKGVQLRPIVNLKPLNRYITTQQFRMTTIKEVFQLLQQKDWAIWLDLKDAYFHVPVHPCHRRFLQFIWQGQAFHYKCLPFGLSSSPRVFTRITKPVVHCLRTRGVKVMFYLDDILVLGSSRSRASHSRNTVIRLLEDLGFSLNWEKSQLTPRQRFIYLGLQWDSRDLSVSLPGDKREELRAMADNLLRRMTVSARQLMSFLGKTTFATYAVPLAHLHTKELQKALRSVYKKPTDICKRLYLPAEARSNLLFWTHVPRVARPLRRPDADVIMATDASETGWGGAGGRGGGGSLHSRSASSQWSAEQTCLHINQLEMLAVHNALLASIGNWRGERSAFRSTTLRQCRTWPRKAGHGHHHCPD